MKKDIPGFCVLSGFLDFITFFDFYISALPEGIVERRKLTNVNKILGLARLEQRRPICTSHAVII